MVGLRRKPLVYLNVFEPRAVFWAVAWLGLGLVLGLVLGLGLEGKGSG